MTTVTAHAHAGLDLSSFVQYGKEIIENISFRYFLNLRLINLKLKDNTETIILNPIDFHNEKNMYSLLQFKRAGL